MKIMHSNTFLKYTFFFHFSGTYHYNFFNNMFNSIAVGNVIWLTPLMLN